MPVVYPTTWIPCHAKDAAQSPQACGLRGLCRLVCNFPWFGWTSYQVTYRDGETIFQIRVENASGVNRGVRQVTLDGNTDGWGYRSSTRRKPNSHALNSAKLGFRAHVPKSTPSNFRYMRGITFSRTPYIVEKQRGLLLRYPGCRAF